MSAEWEKKHWNNEGYVEILLDEGSKVFALRFLKDPTDSSFIVSTTSKRSKGGKAYPRITSKVTIAKLLTDYEYPYGRQLYPTYDEQQGLWIFEDKGEQKTKENV